MTQTVPQLRFCASSPEENTLFTVFSNFACRLHGVVRFSSQTKGDTTSMAHHGAEHHHKAAEHHEQAAAHHREAAKHHESGDHQKAGHHAHIAHGHTLHAAQHAEEAGKHHADQHGLVHAG